MRVELDTDPQPLAAALTARGAEATIEGHILTVTGDDAVVDLVRDLVADLGLGLRRLVPSRTTLEDVFIEASR